MRTLGGFGAMEKQWLVATRESKFYQVSSSVEEKTGWSDGANVFGARGP